MKSFSEQTDRSSKLYPALRNTKNGIFFGYINRNGEFILPPNYTSAYDFTSKDTAIVTVSDKFGLINSNGEFIILPFLNDISPFQEHRAIYQFEHSSGVLSEEGVFLTSKPYSSIRDYHNGRAVARPSNSSHNKYYGYLDLSGALIIPANYELANDFKDHMALVKFPTTSSEIKDFSYALIDPSGNVLHTYHGVNISQYGDNRLLFFKEFGGPLGYLNLNGEEVIPPIYKSAEGFSNQVAVVSKEYLFNGPYGLIDINGKEIYPEKYSSIKLLQENRVALGKPLGTDPFINRNIYAIGDTSGKQLTDFLYYEVGNFQNGFAYASDVTTTFFIDHSGNKVTSLPTVPGSGQLSIKDSLVYAFIDFEPFYLTLSGKTIYRPNTTIPLNDTFSVIKEKESPNMNLIIYYPQVAGLYDLKIQQEVNLKLKELSSFQPLTEDGEPQKTAIKPEDVLPFNYYGTFTTLFFQKNLLCLELTNYYYPLGAAHGMPGKKTPCINLITGEFYNLSDLFLINIDWVTILNQKIKKIIDTDPTYNFIFKDQFKGIKKNQDFYITEDTLYLYFLPYEIGPFAAGFITFKIPLKELDAILNHSGTFYRSFH